MVSECQALLSFGLPFSKHRSRRMTPSIMKHGASSECGLRLTRYRTIQNRQCDRRSYSRVIFANGRLAGAATPVPRWFSDSRSRRSTRMRAAAPARYYSSPLRQMLIATVPIWRTLEEIIKNSHLLEPPHPTRVIRRRADGSLLKRPSRNSLHNHGQHWSPLVKSTSNA